MNTSPCSVKCPPSHSTILVPLVCIHPNILLYPVYKARHPGVHPWSVLLTTTVRTPGYDTTKCPDCGGASTIQHRQGASTVTITSILAPLPVASTHPDILTNMVIQSSKFE